MSRANHPLRSGARRESDIQRDIVKYLKFVLPGGMTFAIPNGSQRTASGYAANAVPGLLPGVADLCHIQPGGKALFFEVKSAGGRLRTEQSAMQLRCSNMDVPYAVVRSIEETGAALAKWGVKTREVVQ